ncbi:MAG: ABC transporter permease subunit [Ruminococcus sp.]|nr:ABC transporter permease subunit [Ruminococcus sp.]
MSSSTKCSRSSGLTALWTRYRKKWFGSDDSAKTVDLTGFSGENGELDIVTVAGNMPVSYVKDNTYAGIAIELAERFCRTYGYTPVISDVDAQASVGAVSSGKYDLCAAPLSVTEERKESISFSDPFYHGGVVLVVRSEELAETENGSSDISISDLNSSDCTIGAATGASGMLAAEKYLPNARLLTIDDTVTACESVKQGKLDAYIFERRQLQIIIDNGFEGVTLLDEDLGEPMDVAAGISPVTKIPELKDKINRFIAEKKADGTLDEMLDRWTVEQNYDMPEIETPASPEMKIKIGTSGIVEPYSFYQDNELTGFDIEFARRFALWANAEIEFEVYDYGALVAAAGSGKIDCIFANLNVTDERAEVIDFSDTMYSFHNAVMVASDKAGGDDVVGDDGDVRSRPFSYYAENGKIGAITGGLYEVEILRRFPDAEVLQFNAQPDLAVALSEGKIDAFTCPVSSAEDFMAEDDSLTYLNEVFMEIPYGFAFRKADGKNELRDQLNEYLAKIHSDGTYDEIVDIWFGSDESRKTVDIPAEGSRVLRYITASTMQPYSYIKDGGNAGLEIDIIARFCKEYGYGLTIDNADFGSLIAGVSSGTYDLASGTIMITEERAQSVDFSDVYYTTNAVAVVRKESSDAAADTANKTRFIDDIKLSFEKNFIREDRYKLILEGIGTTCFMTVMSALFGSLLAFLICMFRRTGSRLANVISNIYVKLLQGTPMVVLLMILYYIIFGKSGIPAVWVAVIGFTLNFGAYVSEIMRSGIESIDGGQREAALALGYNENQTFFKFIFPQAAVRFLPVYNGEVISLLKSTSIVGYIAIQDLTKMSDIIRSRTYEAFFPLIVTAIIYFILAWILSLILKFVLKRISPARKKGAA